MSANGSKADIHFTIAASMISRIFSPPVTEANTHPRGYTPPRYHTLPPQNNIAIRTAVTFKSLEPWHRMRTTNSNLGALNDAGTHRRR